MSRSLTGSEPASQAPAVPIGRADASGSNGDATVHPLIERELREIERALISEGVLPSKEKLEQYYATFRSRFGPEALQGMDGETLLDAMHNHSNRDSLVYWLEFKDDEEFPNVFGSILGGSALKFGVYRRKENGAWAVKGIGNTPQEVNVSIAVEIARRHRNQLLAACQTLAAFPETTDDAEYASLQTQLERVAPDTHDTAWGHKYLSLLFPNKLDDFHSPDYQRYHLVRLLQEPPHADGRYVAAGRYVALAAGMELPLHVLTTLLNRRNGRPRRYWRIGTSEGEAPRTQWSPMRDGNNAAIGWPNLGDLSRFANDRESRDAIVELMRRHYPKEASVVTRKGREVFRFVAQIAEGDRVLACDGLTVLGVGEVAGPYRFDPTAVFPHQRPVDWKSLDEWKMPEQEGLRTTVSEVSAYSNIINAERRLLEGPSNSTNVREAEPAGTYKRRAVGASPVAEARLSGIPGRIQSVLERKSQVILFGPPGTGKTYWALIAACELAARRAFGLPFAVLSESQRETVRGSEKSPNGLVRMCTFHPEYGYEDFIEAYRPMVTQDGKLFFKLVPAIFRRLCEDAVASPKFDFFLVIDEINRGDVPRVFGELLTVLERDKRGQAITLAVSGNAFRVPANVYVIGTMNTADRSISLLDAALRRRFGFVECPPDYTVFSGAVVDGLALGPWLEYVNERVRALVGGDARNRQVGHSFLMQEGHPISSAAQLSAALQDDIIPLLEEYCYEDFNQLAEILGPGIVDAQNQRIRAEIFSVGRSADLIQALQRPEVSTAAGSLTDMRSVNDDDPLNLTPDREPASP